MPLNRLHMMNGLKVEAEISSLVISTLLEPEAIPDFGFRGLSHE